MGAISLASDHSCKHWFPDVMSWQERPSILAADLVYLPALISTISTEPVTKLVNFTEQFQNGYSGYDQFPVK